MDKTNKIKLTKTMKSILHWAATGSCSGSYHPGLISEKRAVWTMKEMGLFGAMQWDAGYPLTKKGWQVYGELREEEDER